MQIDNGTLLAGGALTGILLACWGKLKDCAWRVASLLVVRAHVEGDAMIAFSFWCHNNLRRSRFSERRYLGSPRFVRPENRRLSVLFELFGSNTVTLWQGWRPIFIKLSSPGHIAVTTIRGLFNLEALLIEAVDQFNHFNQFGNGDKESRYSVKRCFGHSRRRNFANEGQSDCVPTDPKTSNDADWRPLKWSLSDLGEPVAESAFDGLAYPPEVDDVIAEIGRWLESERWYKSKSIPWRRGYLLYGPPGTGKTSFVRAIAQHLDLPVFAFDLATFSNAEFVEFWHKLLADVPCIALLEDIDAVFHGRDNVLGEEGGGLTFDCLLNCLSGIESADGVLIFVTTNRLEMLDSALGRPDETGRSTRPGQIDRTIKLGPLDEVCRKRLASLILREYPDEIPKVVREGDGETGAQFSNRCAHLALANFWSNQIKNGSC